MEADRPNPDELLQQIQAEQGSPTRGRLKIFFGYAAGVGKTFSMLEAARAQGAAGVDVVLGYVEPHARPETEALTLGLESLPQRTVEYRNIKIQEFDLDGALARKPALMIVDELAHTNAPGMRHAKRWQDIDELLQAGINVYTTLNVQHVESINDIVAQVSGIQVRETIPDSVFDQADSLEMVDLPPEELLQRFREGKVYVAAQAETAMRNFFQLPRLIALRELALRRMADRISAQAQSSRTGGTQVWATRERLLVCVSPSPTSARIIRMGKRMAMALRATWVVAYVDTSGGVLSDAAREKLNRNLRLAEQLGAETVTLTGPDVADELLRHARECHATKILIGKTGQPRWKDWTGRSVIGRLLRRSGDIDVYVLRGKDEPDQPVTPPPVVRGGGRFDGRGLAKALAVSVLCTGIAAVMRQGHLAETNVVMVYLLGVVLVAALWGRGPGILASILGVSAFDFFFVEPFYTFAVRDTQYFITFGVMLAIAVLISSLTARIRQQADSSRRRERRTAALYNLSRTLASTAGLRQLAASAEMHLSESLASEVAILLPDDNQQLQTSPTSPSSFADSPRELAVAQWAFQHGQMAGAGTDTLPDAHALYLPIAASHGCVGVLAVRPIDLGRFSDPDQRQQLEAMASQIALAIERAGLAEQSEKVLVQAQTEQVRSALLSSVSHDLRTPLAVIAGASSSLLEEDHGLAEATQKEMLQTIYDESNRLSLLVDNLLSITRIESGAVEVNKQWHPAEELVGSALGRMQDILAGRAVNLHLGDEPLLVKLDGVLVEQVLINLLENAAKYTPAGSPVDVSVAARGPEVLFEVADRGSGVSDAEKEEVFAKFRRGSEARKSPKRGAGLGLAICRAVVAVHGGRIWVKDREGGGARFLFTIPLEGPPPAMEPEAADKTGGPA